MILDYVFIVVVQPRSQGLTEEEQIELFKLNVPLPKRWGYQALEHDDAKLGEKQLKEIETKTRENNWLQDLLPNQRHH